MVAIRSVLCPVDLTAASERQVELAAELSRLYGARLTLHHNLHALPVGAAVGWMYAGDHTGAPSEEQVEARLGALLDRLPEGVEREAKITRGLPSQTVMAVAELVGAELVVLATHGATSEEHTSVSELLLEHSERSLLVVHERDVAAGVPDFLAPSATPHVVVVPTDLASGSRAAEELAFDLAGRVPTELHLLHVPEKGRRGEPAREALGDEMRARVPAEIAARVRYDVVEGEPAAAIAEAAGRLGAGCIVMGEHSKSLLRRWFSRDVSRELLHRAPCPVWYVPAVRAS
jgi:nucleotide-binding universal stress UspA family protein